MESHKFYVHLQPTVSYTQYIYPESPVGHCGPSGGGTFSYISRYSHVHLPYDNLGFNRYRFCSIIDPPLTHRHHPHISNLDSIKPRAAVSASCDAPASDSQLFYPASPNPDHRSVFHTAKST